MGRACPGDPCLSSNLEKTWMPGTRAGQDEWDILTILRHAAVAEYVDYALFDKQIGRAGGRLNAERHHQRPCSAAMGHRDGVRLELIVPVAYPDLHRGITLASRRQSSPFVEFAAC